MTADPSTRLVCRIFGSAGAALLLTLVVVSAASAHGTIGAIVDRNTSCASFSYDDGEPMGYVKVSVTAPGLDQPFQSGATDRNGLFCFAPDRNGHWLATANDGMGHQHKLTVTISDPLSDAPTVTTTADSAVSGGDRTSRILAGIGIIFGLTGLLGWYLARRPATATGRHEEKEHQS
jgi:nickel transport protein